MRTIESFEEYVDPIHEAIHEMFLLLLFDQEEPFPDELCDLVTLIIIKIIIQHEVFASRGDSEKNPSSRWDSNPRPSVI